MGQPIRLSTDDLVFRIRQVWLGPTGWTFPFQARYTAWALWLPTFIVCWALMAAVGVGGVLPVWPLVLSVLITYALMGLVDHDVTMRALLRIWRLEIASRKARPPKTQPHRFTDTKVAYR